MKSTKIKLLSRDITIHKMEDNAKNLNPDNFGTINLLSRTIYLDNNELTFETLIHEIKHFYLYYCGIDSEKIDEEFDCRITGHFCSQLMLENGNDIFKQLKEFSKYKNVNTNHRK